ncbi:MAG: S8 family serine peptidase [Alistipes sp.]|nr:S8 family serine peptidase [Alistipes sp.]
MRKFIYFAVAALLAACTADLENQTISTTDSNNIGGKILNTSRNCVGGTLIVRFNAAAESRLAECATRSGATRTGISGVDAVLDKVNGYSVVPLYVVTEKNREKVYSGGYHLWYELLFDESSDMEAVATKLAEVGEVQVVQYVHRVKRVGSPKVVTKSVDDEMPETRATSSIPFNDTHRRSQWGLENLGNLSARISSLPDAVEGADVNVVPAWKLCKGDPSIVVAVLDEGVMNTHEDLKNNIWINEKELNGQSGVDDDSNGYKDDIYGFNFTTMKATITWNKSGDTGHGSHVAGIIAAENNNGIGICGIAGGSGKNDGVKLMSVQIFNGDSGALSSNLVRAFQYAADNGAHISQNSWGYLSAETEDADYWELGPANDKDYKYQLSAEAGAIDYFIKNGGTEDGPIDGGLMIFASGNDNAGLPCYPGAYEPCVAVAAMSPSARPAYYTNFGAGTDISAPGGESLYSNGDILSTVPSDFSASNKPNYGWMQGTSQATPHVSGVAALGLSYAKQLGKRYTANEFRSMLLSASNNMSSYLTGSLTINYTDGSSQTVNYPDYQGGMGSGYIDAYKMLLMVEGTPCKVVPVGVETDIDLRLYFGGVNAAEFVEAVVDEEEAKATGLEVISGSKLKLRVKTSKVGVATISVKMLVGGGSLSNKYEPFPTEVTRKFVVISKEGVATNGGWL